MEWTVEKLIRELRKYPKDALIAWQDHDQQEDEVGGWLNSVFEAEESFYHSENHEWLNGRAVVILRS